MTQTEFTCPDCSKSIEPEKVLIALAQTATAAAVIEDQADVQMDCPECGSDITLPSEEVLVKMAADDATLQVFKQIADEGEAFLSNRSPDLAAAMERERESNRRNAEIQQKLDELKSS